MRTRVKCTDNDEQQDGHMSSTTTFDLLGSSKCQVFIGDAKDMLLALFVTKV